MKSVTQGQLVDIISLQQGALINRPWQRVFWSYTGLLKVRIVQKQRIIIAQNNVILAGVRVGQSPLFSSVILINITEKINQILYITHYIIT